MIYVKKCERKSLFLAEMGLHNIDILSSDQTSYFIFVNYMHVYAYIFTLRCAICKMSLVIEKEQYSGSEFSSLSK